MGAVGGGTYEVLKRNAEKINQRSGVSIEVVHLGMRKAKAGLDTGDLRVSSDVLEVAGDPEVDLIVESIGGTEIARHLILKAIANGKHVVTANKALIAEQGSEIFAAAAEQGVSVGYEAAVAGGIPIIGALREGLAANDIQCIFGIINGTGNFILTEMRDAERPFADVLTEAQALGYAEANPSFDIDGIDAAHKLTIMASIAFAVPLQFHRVYTQGISAIENEDVRHAEELGHVIKHLGICRRTARGIELRVHPTLIPFERLLAKVDGVMNAVMVQSDAAQSTLYYGPGAGAEPTASSVVADIIAIARQTGSQSSSVPYLGVPLSALRSGADNEILDIDECETSFYLRFRAEDRPGVLSRITQAVSDAGISVEAIQQKEPAVGDSQATIVMITNQAPESRLRALVQTLNNLDVISREVVCIRVENLA